MAAPHPSSVNPGSSEDEAQERPVLVKASMVYGLLQINHQLIRQIQHGLLTGQLANVTNKLQVAESLLGSKDLEVKKIERIVEVKASIVDDLESTIQQLLNQITICQEQTKALEDEIRDLRAVQEMLPKKVDTLTEAMDGIKEKIFASGPMEESETNKNVNAEEDRGIQQNLGGMNEEVPLELEVGNQQRLKTKLCCHWEKLSRCSFGDSYCFAHGNHELRPLIPNHRYKTKLCKSVTDGNDCSFGDGCHFAHSSEELHQAIRHPQD